MRGAAWILATCLILAGCAGRQHPPEKVADPLLGGPALPDKGPSPATGSDPLTDTPKEPLPPTPPGEKKASPASLTAPASGSASSAGVKLGSPRAVDKGGEKAGPGPSNFSPQGPASYEAIQAQLRSQGVEWQALTYKGGESWHFICALPNPDNPALRDNFEVTRDGGNGLNAMKAVLEEIGRRKK
jgi:predicted component of type VI protein secretion system